jgi:hypothetical protein
MFTESPPLPEPLPLPAEPAVARAPDTTGPAALPIPFPPIRPHAVRAGSWLLQYSPKGPGLVRFDGTLRVEAHSAGRTASGDLYQRRVILLPPHLPVPPFRAPVLLPGPHPAHGIPVLARSRYRYYLSVTQILEHFTFGNSFQLGFEMWRFTAPNSWSSEGAFTAQMTWMSAPAGYPSAGDYLEGDVKNAAGTVVGRLKMGWLSPYFRKASVEIDTVAGREQPLDNGAGVVWKSIFDAAGWDVSVRVSNTDVAEPSGAGWSDGEMHAAMLARRDAISLDTDWRYHILAVRLIDSTPRGIMYDAGGTDSNNVPREGVGIATDWIIPDTPVWGLVRGLRFGAATAPYFRTAVHELGHAMGLFHNTVDNGFMNTTDVIAASATPANPFPNNIKWNFAEDDLKRLRHYPDVFVRPGGSAFGTASTTTPPISPTDLQVAVPGLELRVTPLLGELPIGAPARVGLELVNTGETAQRVPAKLSLKTDFLRGWVSDPAGTARSFSPVVRCIEDEPMLDLAPGESIRDSLTLLRGYDGALFPAPGLHRIDVELRWDVDGMEAVVAGGTTVMVTGSRDAAHAAAAHEVLATPDAHLVLVLGGDHLSDGMRAVGAAVGNDVLRPHFAAVEAKRLAQRAGRRAPDLAGAAALVDEETVMSGTELGKLAKLVKAAKSKSNDAQALGKTLKAKAERLDLPRQARAAVDAL